MNGFGNYADEDGDVYDELIAEGRAQERKALAATLTRLRKLQAGDNPAAHIALLDAIAKTHGLHTQTEVRYAL